MTGHAADVPGSSSDAASRLESIKSNLLDLTPGAYISPLLTASYAVGTTDVGPLSFDFEGYFIRAGAALGYQEHDFRLDLEPSVGFARTETDEAIAQIGGSTKSNIKFATLTVNAYYDLPIDLGEIVSSELPAIRPYLGAGLGGIYLDVEDIDEDLALVAQAMTGLGLRIAPRSTLDLGYRLVYLPRVEIGGADLETVLHAFEVKLRYRF
jgi:opacity protein-like surface antigen